MFFIYKWWYVCEWGIWKNFDEEEFYEEMVEQGLTEKSIKIDGVNIDIEILNFGEVDPKFYYFIKNNLCDSREHSDIYIIGDDNIYI